jgi:hypothetical protein
MRWIGLLLVLVVGAVSLTGCAMDYTAPVQPPSGFLITSVKAPLTIDFDQTPVCRKRGSASTHYFYEPFFTHIDFAWGDADMRSALRDGRMSSVEYADYELLSIFGIYGKFTVNVYGN